jgi:hypothetical protein
MPRSFGEGLRRPRPTCRRPPASLRDGKLICGNRTSSPYVALPSTFAELEARDRRTDDRVSRLRAFNGGSIDV